MGSTNVEGKDISSRKQYTFPKRKAKKKAVAKPKPKPKSSSTSTTPSTSSGYSGGSSTTKPKSTKPKAKSGIAKMTNSQLEKLFKNAKSKSDWNGGKITKDTSAATRRAIMARREYNKRNPGMKGVWDEKKDKTPAWKPKPGPPYRKGYKPGTTSTASPSPTPGSTVPNFMPPKRKKSGKRVIQGMVVSMNRRSGK